MPERIDLKAPKGAPNVVVVLIDDMGFGWCGHQPIDENMMNNFSDFYFKSSIHECFQKQP